MTHAFSDHTIQDEPHRTCAVVVTFNPDAGFADRLQRLLLQFPAVFIVDNASTSDVSDLVQGLDAGDHIRWHDNSANVGIARALNQGLTQAAAAGFSWAVTFDQDTTIYPSFLDSLLVVARQYTEREVLVGGNYLDLHRGRIAHRCRGGCASFERTTLITSGMLLPIHFAIGIGGFREDYFIDSVDHEFCLRAAAHGAAVVMTAAPIMEHRIGQARNGGRRTGWLSSNHAPIRKYYIARNTLTTVRSFVWSHPVWSLRQLLRLAAEAFAIVCFETGKKAKLGAFGRGLRDGLRDARRT